MPEVSLDGLAEPVLAHHLCALGVFRAVARQIDAEATLHFRDDGVPCLVSEHLAADGLRDWIMSSWKPSPMLSPWNSGAGFGGSSKSETCIDKVKRDGIAVVEATTDPRLSDVRRVIADVRKIVAETGYDPKATKVYSKETFLRDLRVRADETLLPWVDAAAVVELAVDSKSQTERARAGYLPILGTGGNDGRLDLSNNLLLHLCRLLGFSGNLLKRPKNADLWSRSLLNSLLFDEWTGGMAKDSAGQFLPASRAAPNGTSGPKSMEAEKQVNPWLFVWSLEGALLFAGAATRRLGSHGRAYAAFPFHADSIDAGYGTSASESLRSELWLPVWKRPATYREVRRLFGEARAQVGRRRAQNGIDYALAATTLGSVRGLRAFERYTLAERAGQSYIAVHVGTFPVGAVPTADRLCEVDPFVRRMRSAASAKNAPPRLKSAVRAYDTGVFALTRRNEPERIEDVLAALGRLERERVKGTGSEKVHALRLRDASWLEELGHPSTELLLASALASLPDRGALGTLGAYLGTGGGEKGSRVEGAENLALLSLLDAIGARRLLELASPELNLSVAGTRAGLSGHASALRASDIAAFLRPGEIDERRTCDLAWALSTMDRRSIAKRNLTVSRHRRTAYEIPPSLPLGWAAMRLAVEGTLWDDDDQPVAVRVPGVMHGLLRAGRSAEALAAAERALRSAGLSVVPGITAPSASHVMRLIASFLFPLPIYQLRVLRRAVTSTPSPQENS